MKKPTFIFRPKMNMLLTYVAAMFSPKNMPDRSIDPPKREHHRVSKKEQKRRERCRHMNPHRKH